MPLAGIRRRKQGRKGRRRNPLSAAIPAGNQKPNRKNSTKTCRSGVREELRITPAKVERIQYLHEVLACPVCREEDTGTIVKAPVPTALLAHSPASPSMAAFVMYQKFLNSVPFYRQEMDYYQPGRPGNYAKNFLEGFSGLLECDGYTGSGFELIILIYFGSIKNLL